MSFDEEYRLTGGGLIDVIDKTLSFGKRKRNIEEVDKGGLNSIKDLSFLKRCKKNVHVSTVYDKSKLASRPISTFEFFQAIDLPSSCISHTKK